MREPVKVSIVELLALKEAQPERQRDAAMREEIERLRQQNDALRAGMAKMEGLRVSDKGAVSLYGIGRFPVTLYKEQWERLLQHAAEIRAFIDENRARLRSKK